MRLRIAAVGLLAAGALTAAAVTAARSPAGAHATAGAQPTPIQHVVVIYAENHSFDNILGYWCQANPARCPDGGMPASVTLSDGTVVTPGTTPDDVPLVNHSVAAQVAAMDGGKMDGWQNIPYGGCDAATGYQCISGYQPSQVPNLTTLAQNFAISDETFSMADSPSWGGHLYAVAGTLDGFTGDNPAQHSGLGAPGWGCDSGKLVPWISPAGRRSMEPSCVPDPALPLANGGAFEPTPVKHVPTIMDQLDAAALTWKLYGAPKAAELGYMWSVCPMFAGCVYTGQNAGMVPSRSFPAAAQAGTLPAFSLVTPGGGTKARPRQGTYLDSCHNQFSITACDNWIGADVAAVENGPDWASTAIFITFDDFGGFYDQAPPPSSLNADGQQAGPRSPLIIVSPYAKPGYTDTTPATFAGILAYTEHTFGLAPLAANDAAAYDFASAFNYSQPPLRPARMVSWPLPQWARHLKLTPAMVDDPS